MADDLKKAHEMLEKAEKAKAAQPNFDPKFYLDAANARAMLGIAARLDVLIRRLAPAPTATAPRSVAIPVVPSAAPPDDNGFGLGQNDA